MISFTIFLLCIPNIAVGLRHFVSKPISCTVCYGKPSDINYGKLLRAEPYLREKPYSELLQDVDKREIQHLYFTDDLKKIYSDSADNELLTNTIVDYTVTYSSPTLANTIIDASRKTKTETYILQKPVDGGAFSVLTQGVGILGSFLNAGFTFYIAAVILSLIFRRNNPGSGMGTGIGSGMNPFGGSMNSNMDVKKAKENMQKANISLADWAGSPEIFEECAEVVSYLKNGTNYKAAGAEIPKGILLAGEPGTGKTLLAKAIASECDANFVSVAASEFVEVFVGLGAQKVRKLFQQARENTPCILFIDEIDSIGKQRGTGVNLGNDEREQTLNQLLAEMDGFNQNDGVLIIAATNRKDVLDSALLRPGRFDRTITVPLPDVESRKAIFKVHTRNKNIVNNTDVGLLAEMTQGFSGAQIKNLVNEAAILAARKGETIIKQDDLTNALEKLIVGIIKRNDTRTEDTRARIAIHEIGHAFLSTVFSQYFVLKKVTIQATYDGAGGYTLFNERPEVINGGLYTKELLKKRLVVAMGGKAAESLYYGEDFVSLGAVQDLKTANSLAQSMIGNFGMGEDLKVFYNEETDSGRTPFLGRSLAMGARYSDKTREKMDEESLTLVKEAYKEAFQILSRNKNMLSVLCKELLEKETISGKDLLKILRTDTQNSA